MTALPPFRRGRQLFWSRRSCAVLGWAGHGIRIVFRAIPSHPWKSLAVPPVLWKGILMGSSTSPEGPGSVSGAPDRPAGLIGTFTSRYVDTGELRLHAVTGGEGPPLLLVHGWPQTWYARRMLMPALARDFSVVAVDQRGIGLSGKPQGGYDTATLAGDLVALMDALGHPRFAVA